jgi:hypothetical protein
VSLHKRLSLTLATLVFVVGSFASTAHAQVRRGRAVSRVVVVGGGFYDPFWYSPYWYDPWFAGPYQWGYPPYRGRYLAPDASVKLEVKPNQAEVYVDGYYAGIVDDFDGAFQRLHVAPGEHELELYLDGYRPVKQKVYLTADNTFKIKYNLEKASPGEQNEPRPQPPMPPPPPMMQGGGQQPYPPAPYPPAQPQRGPAGRRLPPPPPPQAPGAPGDPRGAAQADYGTLSIRVQPNDAEVSIDGEPWRAPGGQDRLVVEVPEGSHTVEIRKSGYRTYVTQVDVHRGQTTPLNVSLRGEQ